MIAGLGSAAGMLVSACTPRIGGSQLFRPHRALLAARPAHARRPARAGQAVAFARRLGWFLVPVGPGGPVAMHLATVLAETVAHLEGRGVKRALIAQALALAGIAGEGRAGVARQAEEAGPLGELEAAVTADPANHQARFEYAQALHAAGEVEAAIDQLLDLFRRDREWNDGAARTQLFTIFEALNAKDPIVLKGRRKLSSMIFA